MIYSFKRIRNNTIEYGFALEKSNDWTSYQEITDKEHNRLLTGQSEGKTINFKDDATPYLTDPEPQKTEKEKFDDGLISKEEYNALMNRQREAAYRQEADPLGMQAMRGDIDKSEWLAKIVEIKKRYPKVE